MAHLLLEIPKHVEDGFDDVFDLWVVGLRGQEQQIDVGLRREAGPAVAANSDDRVGPGGASVDRRYLDEGLVPRLYDEIFYMTEIFSAGLAPAAVLQPCARLVAASVQEIAESKRDLFPEARCISAVALVDLPDR